MDTIVDLATGHNYGDWIIDENHHWKECSCGKKSEEAAHSGGSATCTAKAKCSTCSTEYGVFADHKDLNQDSRCDECDIQMNAGQTIEELENEQTNVSLQVPEDSNAGIPVGTILDVVVLEESDLSGKAVRSITDQFGSKSDLLAFYDISLLLDDVQIQPNGKILVTIPVSTLEWNYEGIKVIYIADDGSVEECVTIVNENGSVSFETEHFSKYAVIGVNERGLQAGAIIGIVICTAIVLGVGGFSIFWFAIKKKRFMDLISIVRKARTMNDSVASNMSVLSDSIPLDDANQNHSSDLSDNEMNE